MFSNTIELAENEITAFVVDGQLYRVLATEHAMKRLKWREVDKYYICSACIALGTKLEQYNNSGKQIMIIDKGKKMSTVITIELYKIVIITVLDKDTPYVKKGMESRTVIENFTCEVG